ncbi:MAG: prepilin-type N-terminal cleavage/methylation domain-containing protein [Planctomycetaceae bacterium]|jgi:prepilin-type N-terminal cleavage/methylation domain-containing protein|nr:prepilin-type N-terminal cleavage/methylation domain-containing protein [Planctomycetaceae bacterium]
MYFLKNFPNTSYHFDLQRRSQQAFTLLELLIVLSIIVVIAAIGMPGLMRMNVRNRIDSAARELQSDLNLTRLEAMKSGEPLVFRFQSGTGNYEILSKQEYDRLTPKQPQSTSGLNGEIAGTDASFEETLSGDTSSIDPLDIEQDDIVGSIPPSLGDYGTTSLAETLANTSSPALTDYGMPSSLGDLGEASSLGNFGDAPSLGDLGDAPTVADRFAQPMATQQIAALPVSKFMPKQKELSDDLIFADVASYQPELQQDISIGVAQNGFQQNFMPNISPQNMSLQNASQQSRWSEPIFFFPNGRTSNAHFAVCTTGRYNYFVDVSVRGLTGTARIGKIDVWSGKQ